MKKTKMQDWEIRCMTKGQWASNIEQENRKNLVLVQSGIIMEHPVLASQEWQK